MTTPTFPANFQAALAQSGIAYDGPIVADDKLHRIKCNDDREANGWYVLRLRGDVHFGGYGDWKRNINEGWSSIAKNKMTAEQRKEYHDAYNDAVAQDKKEREEKQAKARQVITDGLKVWPKATSHAYLDGKKLKPMGEVRICKNELYPGWLVVPMIDDKGQVQSCQFIAEDGKKRFLYGGMIQGCYFPVNEEKSGPLVICEGYATGVSVANATDWQTVCAFNCGNLLAVARIARNSYPDRLVIVAGDDDKIQSCRQCKADVNVDLNPTVCPSCNKEHGQTNSGVVKGMEAAKAVGGIFVAPKFQMR